MNPKISIIIPVYKCAGTIERTVESVAAQSMKEVEIIFVDDRSFDGSIEAALDAAKRLCGEIPYKMLACPSNSGPGFARNLGLEAACGEYVAFLDADDTLDPGFCEKMYKAAAGKDLACCDVRLVNPDGSSRLLENPSFESKKRYLLNMVSYFSTYLYRKEMLLKNGIEFPSSKSAEDSCFLLCSILASDSLAKIDEPLYLYYRTDSSLSGRKNRKRALWRIKSFNAFLKFVHTRGLAGRYGLIALWLYIKKGLLLAVRDMARG